MSIWHRLLFDLLCPSFLYAIASSTFFTILIYGILKTLKIENPKWKSFLYLLPLLAPLVVFVLLPPQVMLVILQISAAEDTTYFFASYVHSITGFLCLIGLIASLTTLAILYIFGSKLVYWFQGVVELAPQDNPTLFATTERLAKRAGVLIPRLGLTEDLRPNAFTIGYGKKPTIVCTLGLLNALTDRDLEAVIAHEVAHIKNRDFHFNVLTLVLQIVSFYNPLAYFLAAAIRRERELFADRTGITFLKQPASLGLALTKIWEASREYSRNHLRGWISRLFIFSELRCTHKTLLNHPDIEKRLTNLIKERFCYHSRQKEILRLCIACTLIFSMVLLFFVPLIQIPLHFSSETHDVHAIGLQTVSEDVSPTTFVLDSNYLRISNYFRIYYDLQIYKYYRIVYLPSYPNLPSHLRDPIGLSTVFTANYPKADHFTTILIGIVTFTVIAVIMIMLIQVCYMDLENALKVQLHKKIKIKG